MLDQAIFERNGALQDRAQSVCNSAFHLRLDHIGVDGDAAIDGTHHTINFDFAASIAADFDDLRHKGSKCFDHSNSARFVFAQGLGPLSFLSGEIEHRQVTRMFGQ